MSHVENRNLFFLIKAYYSQLPKIHLKERSGYGSDRQKETVRDRWRNATRRYERDTQAVHKVNEPRALSPGPSVFTAFLALSHENRPPCLPSPTSLLFSCTFVVIACFRWTSDLYLACPFSVFLLSSFLRRSLAGLPARPYRHSIASVSLFSTLSPRHISALPTRHPYSSSLCVVDFPLPSCIYPLSYYPTRSPSLCTRKRIERNDRSSRWKVSPPPISPHG